MYQSVEKLYSYKVNYPLEQFAPLDKILFLDIETTGLSPVYSQLYMIGLAYEKNGVWCIEQWMAESPEEESELVKKLSGLLPEYTHIFHFNGNRFDIPFLTEKAGKYQVPLDFKTCQGIDIFKRAASLKKFLLLPDCRQKTIEQFLGMNRTDKYNGGELIQLYKTYTASPTDSLRQTLIQHNRDDMKGMLDIVPILAYIDLAEKPLPVIKAELLKSVNVEHKEVYELSMTSRLATPVPKRIFAQYDNNFLIAEGTSVIIKVPVYTEELKFYYANYKDYYYIPSLDCAFHKSVASGADPSMRVKATASTCYTKKEGMFLKQYQILIEPFFKRDFKDKETFFEITAETKKNRELFGVYNDHILKTIIQH